jgi:hypothetical protein
MKPIETRWGNYRFRSRTEARWAIFFTELGIPFDYEKEGFDLAGEWYLPDFYIPFWDVFIEIKADEPSEAEVSKCRNLALQAGKQVWLVYGQPAPFRHKVLRYYAEQATNPLGNGWGHDLPTLPEFRQCRRCPEIFLAWYNSRLEQFAAGGIGHPETGDYMAQNPRHECLDRLPTDSGRIGQAFQKAMSARFEHGEQWL